MLKTEPKANNTLWLFSLIAALLFALIMSINFYLIKQNEEQISKSAANDAKSLAVFIGKNITHSVETAKFLAQLHRDRILELASGGGYPYDLEEIISDVHRVLPDGSEFAITNQHGEVVMASDRLVIGNDCKALMRKTMRFLPMANVEAQAHISNTNQSHFDYMIPIQSLDSVAGLWMRFSFQPLQSFINNSQSDGYELVMVEELNSDVALLGSLKVQKNDNRLFNLLQNFSGFSEKSPVITHAPIQPVGWHILAIEKNQSMQAYRIQVFSVSMVLFALLLVIGVLISKQIRRLHSERQRLDQQFEHDKMFNAGPTVLLERGVDKGMTMSYASPNAQNLLHRTQQGFINAAYMDWVKDDDREAIRKKLIQSYSKGIDTVELIYRVLSADTAEYKWIYDLTHIVYDKMGNPLLLRGYITSIHAQKTAEKNANELIQAIPEPVFVTTLNGRIIEANQAAENLLGCDKQVFLGRTFSEWVDIDSFDAYENSKKTLIHQATTSSQQSTMPTNLLIRDANGRKIHVDLIFNLIELNNKKSIIKVVRDVTAQTRTQQQLQLAKEQAEGLAQARSRFVATVSHEIRTPMNGVLGMTDLLFDTPLNPQQQTYLHAIKQSGQLLLNIINEVLDFARFEEGEIKLKAEEASLKDILQEALHLLSANAEEKHLPLKLDFDSRIPESLLIDRIRIQQLIMNLVGNAIKFTEQGDIVIKIEMIRQTSDRVSLMLRVIDKGIGIDEKHLQGLFDSFSQADSNISRQYGGTGLGLAIAKQIVELMGGEIGVNSQLGLGSEFWVKLNFEIAADLTAINALEVIDDAAAASLNNKHILLIEDNEINQNVIASFVERLGAKVDIAENGLKGLDDWRLNADKYDMILMDCQMPVMDGYEVTRLIRSEETLAHPQRHIPIVALTANAMVDDRDKCIRAGMDDFMAKPIERHTFARMLQKWCQ
ncbi:ATP-binding protein [Thiomicrorhabdus sediminis]|uniref:histidine kinase n=1 Tax=Thiomicrorhabdus sediminis TaxID=2580412 RepID=A0A4P9K392_9GAMM|nr:ATP-binding protein [Thiomicrorhabdus sediminis]QCU89344.1 response regulator [Thiomicrorhabdus sediminis]